MAERNVMEGMGDRRGRAIVIAGNGMVSHRLCRKLVEIGGAEGRNVTVLGEERRPAYDRVNLARYFESTDEAKLLLSPARWYPEHGITLKTGVRVTAVDRVRREVTTSLGETLRYDRLVLATGSRPRVPDIVGHNLPGLYVYRTIGDAEAIFRHAKRARRAAVIGGGLLGLEAVDVLRRFKCDTTVIQSASSLMCRQLNEDAGELLLRKVAELGIRVKLRTITERITESRDGLRVEFRDGDSLGTDMVVVAAGIRPRDELGRDCGLPVAGGGGILVNDQMQTEDPAIYAVGECAAHHGRAYGLVGPCYQQADALAAHLSGLPASYQGSDESCRLKIMGLEVSVFGDFLGAGHHVVHRGRDVYRSVVVEHGRLVGATVVGPWQKAGGLELAVKERRRLSRGQLDRFAGTGELAVLDDIGGVRVWPAHATVCNCTQTSAGRLRACLSAGADSIGELTRQTGAGGVCGSCGPLLAELVGADSGAILDACRPRGQRVFWWSAWAAIVVALCLWLVPPLPVAETVQAGYFRFTQTMREPGVKQVTGFSIAGLSLLALLLSARKRVPWMNIGAYGFWRAAHTVIGVLSLVGLILHTGLNFGENLNSWLLICFLTMNTAGALAAVAASSEARFSGPSGRWLRGVLTRAHLFFFWPYPVLLGAHIATVYLY